MIDLFAASSLPSLAGAVLATLFDLTVKGALILALAGLLTTRLKNASAATRHLIWCLALCGVLVLPVLTVTLPAWRLPILSTIPSIEEVAASLGGETGQGQAIPAEMSGDAAPAGGEATPVTPAHAPLEPEAARSDREGVAPATPRLAHEVILGAFIRVYDGARAAPWPVWLFVVWAGGMVLVLARFLVGAMGVGWLAYRARLMRDPDWIHLTGEIQERIGLRRRVRLLRSMHTAMPMTWGILRPVVLLPVRAHDWSEARRRCVLTHELAHVRRWDCLTQTLAQIACAVNWFNPLVWVAARRMRHERELACDDYVLRAAVRPSDYATHLLDIARTTRSTLVAPLGAVAMARASQLEDRVLAMLDAARNRNTPGRLAAGGGFLLALALVVPLAAMRPADATAIADEPAFRRVATEQGEAYQWSGRVEEGQTIDIRGLRGHVQATPSQDRVVKVMALPRDEAFSGDVRVVEEEGEVVFCLPHPEDPDACAADTWHGERADDQPNVDFVAFIPEGVHFSGQTVDGNVTVVGLRSDVEAVTVDGNIFVQATGRVSAHAVEGSVNLRTASYARASTRDGDIHARLGRTDWTGPLPFNSVDGDITVELPEEAHTDIDLHVEADGHLQSVIHLKRQTRDEGERFRGTLGEGGRLLAIHTIDGNITITHRGNQTVQPRENFDVRAPREEVRPSRRDRPVYRAEATSAPRKNQEAYADASPAPDVRREKDVSPGTHSVDPAALAWDIETQLGRLRRQVGRLDAALNDDLFETAARAISALDLGVAIDKRDLIELVQIVDGTEARYTRQLKRLGLDDFTREDLVLARLVGVNTGYVQSVRQAGYCPSLKELVAMKIAGVDRQYLRDMASKGYEELPVRDLVTLRKSGVDREVIQEMEERGIHTPTVEEMVDFKSDRGPVPH